MEDCSPSRITLGAASVGSRYHCLLTPEGLARTMHHPGLAPYGKSRFAVLGDFMVGRTLSIIKRSDKEV